jgi:hypothetical protein
MHEHSRKTHEEKPKSENNSWQRTHEKPRELKRTCDELVMCGIPITVRINLLEEFLSLWNHNNNKRPLSKHVQ